MAKRGAGSELNDRNWDDEEEPEEAGMFTQAAKSVLEQRTMKKAKRRVVGDSSGTKSGAFSGFSGFGVKASTPSTETVSGFKKIDGDSVSGSMPSSFEGTSSVNGKKDQKLKGQGDTKDSSTYLNCLKSLNESVLAWIKQHVETNPYIILTPVFKDYEKYLEVIQAEKSSVSSATSASDEEKDSQGAESTAAVSSKPISFGSTTLAPKPNDDQGKQPEAAKSKPFTFGQTTTENSTLKGFSFASSSTSSSGSAVKFTSASSTPGAGFFFGQNSSASSSLFGKPPLSGSSNPTTGLFSFGKTASQESSSAEGSQEIGEKDNEEYEPPKPEVKEIVEADALYSIRCKLYYQKEGQWVDRGVGNLHLKPVAENKTQLLIRADTNLGNILLNIMLSSTTPATRQGKNNVALVCVPNPPINTAEGESTPIPMLIRVKTGEDADELLAKIEERKKLL